MYNHILPTLDRLFEWASTLPDDWVYTSRQVITKCCPTALWCKIIGGWADPRVEYHELIDDNDESFYQYPHGLVEFINLFDSIRNRDNKKYNRNYDYNSITYTKAQILEAIEKARSLN